MMSFDDERGVPAKFFGDNDDVYIKYSHEEVAFHWNSKTALVVKRKFFGTGKESEIATSNRLFNDARVGGKVISREEYMSL